MDHINKDSIRALRESQIGWSIIDQNQLICTIKDEWIKIYNMPHFKGKQYKLDALAREQNKEISKLSQMKLTSELTL